MLQFLSTLQLLFFLPVELAIASAFFIPIVALFTFGFWRPWSGGLRDDVEANVVVIATRRWRGHGGGVGCWILAYGRF